MESNEQRHRSDGSIGDTWAGVFRALRDAVDETLEDIRSRGEGASDRARDAARTARERAQSSMADAREKLDLVHRRELEELQREVDALRLRVAALEADRSAETGEPPRTDIPIDFG